MKKWESRDTRTRLKDFVREGGSARTAFHCDQHGQCLLRDLSRDAGERVPDTLNEEGQKGWEWVQWGTRQDELMRPWKGDFGLEGESRKWLADPPPKEGTLRQGGGEGNFAGPVGIAF